MKTIRSETPGGPRQRHGPDHDERDAEHEGRGVGRREAGERHEDSSQDRQRPGDPPQLPRALRDRLGRVPDRRDDVQAADPYRGQRDDHEREQHPEAEADDQARRLDVAPDLHACEVERRRQDEHHAERDGDAENHPYHGGEEVVDEPLEQIELHQVAAPRADGAGDPELAPPLGCEHHEDQEDQQAAGEDGEAAEGREDRHESIALGVGGFERVALDRIDLEPSRRHDGIDDRRDLVGQLGARELVAPVRDQHMLDLSDPAEEPLGRVERQEQGGAVGAGAFVVDDLADRDGQRVAFGIQPELVAGLSLELLGRVGVQEDLATAQVVEVLRLSVGVPPDLAEGAEVGLAACEERHPRLALPGRDALDGEGLHDRGGDAVDEVLVAEQQLVLDLREDLLREVLDAGRPADLDLGVDVGAAHGHELVRLAQ